VQLPELDVDGSVLRIELHGPVIKSYGLFVVMTPQRRASLLEQAGNGGAAGLRRQRLRRVYGQEGPADDSRKRQARAGRETMLGQSCCARHSERSRSASAGPACA